VADGDRAAADVHLFFVEFEHPDAGEGLGGEGFVQLDQVDVRELEAGPLEISLRDTGGLKTALAQYAKGKGLSEDEARTQIIDSLNETAKAAAQSNPDALVVGQAIAQFIQTPMSTLTITVTPKGKVRLKQAFDAANVDPASSVSLFTVEAKTTQ